MTLEDIMTAAPLLSIEEQCNLQKFFTDLILLNESTEARYRAEAMWQYLRREIMEKEPEVDITGAYDFRSAEWRGLTYVQLRKRIPHLCDQMLADISRIGRPAVNKARKLYEERLTWDHQDWMELKEMNQFINDKLEVYGKEDNTQTED